METALLNLGTAWHSYVHHEGDSTLGLELQEARRLVLDTHAALIDQAVTEARRQFAQELANAKDWRVLIEQELVKGKYEGMLCNGRGV
jgi:hypothetical protein